MQDDEKFLYKRVSRKVKDIHDGTIRTIAIGNTDEAIAAKYERFQKLKEERNASGGKVGGPSKPSDPKQATKYFTERFQHPEKRNALDESLKRMLEEKAAKEPEDGKKPEEPKDDGEANKITAKILLTESTTLMLYDPISKKKSKISVGDALKSPEQWDCVNALIAEGNAVLDGKIRKALYLRPVIKTRHLEDRQKRRKTDADC